MTSPHQLFIALPAYAGIQPATFETLLRITGRDPFRDTIVRFVGGCPWIDIARSELVAAFLQTRASYLLFLDSDISFPIETFHTLLKLDTDIALGNYREKTSPHAWTGAGETRDLKDSEILHKNEQRFIRLTRAGLGCSLIKRYVFEQMVLFNKSLVFRSENSQQDVCHLFHHIVQKDSFGVPRILAEDKAFFLRAQELGFTLDCAIDIEVSHSGISAKLGSCLSDPPIPESHQDLSS